METAKVAAPIIGDKLYQQRARKALPILVRQALAGTTIFYSDLAAELEMPNPRNLNYPLGSIGQTLKNLSTEWDEEVPQIQCLGVNKKTGLPGEGFGWFITGRDDFGQLPRKRQWQFVEPELKKIFSFQKWHKVLHTLGLEPVPTNFRKVLANASRFRGGGESQEHKKLKDFIARHPKIVNLPPNVACEKEHQLPSGDAIDVFFKKKDEQIAVEVKPRSSLYPDIVRGLFQCVKYRAVLEARQASEEQPKNARAVLVLGGLFPKELIPLKNILGVETIDNVDNVSG